MCFDSKGKFRGPGAGGTFLEGCGRMEDPGETGKGMSYSLSNRDV